MDGFVNLLYMSFVHRQTSKRVVEKLTVPGMGGHPRAVKPKKGAV